jgi:hypothetical protein
VASPEAERVPGEERRVEAGLERPGFHYGATLWSVSLDGRVFPKRLTARNSDPPGEQGQVEPVAHGPDGAGAGATTERDAHLASKILLIGFGAPDGTSNRAANALEHFRDLGDLSGRRESVNLVRLADGDRARSMVATFFAASQRRQVERDRVGQGRHRAQPPLRAPGGE